MSQSRSSDRRSPVALVTIGRGEPPSTVRQSEDAEGGEPPPTEPGRRIREAARIAAEGATQ